MGTINLKFLPALAACLALALAGCGDDETTGSASSAGGNGIDRAFVADMVPHHESAIAMARIAQSRGESAFVKKLAGDIVTSQEMEISTMRSADEALETAGVKRGSLGVPEHKMGMDADTSSLKSAEPFDEAFIKMMIPHHEGALEMAKVELSKGEDPELKALAQKISDAQTREIAEMRDHLGDSSSSGDDDMKDEGHGSGHG